MTGWYLYIIGALMLLTEMLERKVDVWHALPPEARALTWVIVVGAALLWPAFATAIVITRFLKAFRNG